MKDALERRLKQLKEEYATGQQRIKQQEEAIAELKNTVLRISGAIQVIEEELNLHAQSNT